MSQPSNVNATQPLRLVDQRTMEKIFAVTDAAGINRERLRIPLAGEGDGRVHRTADGEWEIVVPGAGDLVPFLDQLALAVGGR